MICRRKNIIEFLTLDEVKYIHNLLKGRYDFDTITEALSSSKKTLGFEKLLIRSYLIWILYLKRGMKNEF